MNLAEFRDAVRVRIGAPNADSFSDDPSLTDLVNEGLQAISADVDDGAWLTASTTFATVAGTQTYTPPADWTRTKLLIIDGNTAIEWAPLAEIRECPTTSTGLPTHYTVFGDVILLAPVPDAVYTIKHDYIVDEPALVGDTDTPLLPSAFHYTVVAFATHLAHLRGGDSNRATVALADYQQWLKRMQDQKRRSIGPIRVRIRPGSVY